MKGKRPSICYAKTWYIVLLWSNQRSWLANISIPALPLLNTYLLSLIVLSEKIATWHNTSCVESRFSCVLTIKSLSNQVFLLALLHFCWELTTWSSCQAPVLHKTRSVSLSQQHQSFTHNPFDFVAEMSMYISPESQESRSSGKNISILLIYCFDLWLWANEWQSKPEFVSKFYW